MKKIVLIALAATMFAACSSKELSKEEASKQIAGKFGYPKAFEYELNLVDPAVARNVKEIGLADSGLVTLKETWSMLEEAQPKIFFTEKASPYLLGTPEGEMQENARMVKLAEMDVSAINDIRKTDDTHAEVTYTVSYKNITPFSILVERTYEPEQQTAAFYLNGDKWEIAGKP